MAPPRHSPPPRELPVAKIPLKLRLKQRRKGTQSSQRSAGAPTSTSEAIQRFYSATAEEQWPPRFTLPLWRQEEEVVQAVFGGPSDRTDEVLATISPEYTDVSNGAIRLTRKDFRLLQDDGWLSDEIVNAYMHLINNRNARIHAEVAEADREGFPNTHAFNSFFYNLLKGEDYTYDRVRRWTEKYGIDVLEFDLLLFPIHINEVHWTLAVVGMNKKYISYLDPFYNQCPTVHKNLKRWLKDEITSKHSADRAAQLGIEDWTEYNSRYFISRIDVLPESIELVSDPPRWTLIPFQTDDSSCGIFALSFANCISWGIKIYFNTRAISILRKRILLHLLARSLPFK